MFRRTTLAVFACAALTASVHAQTYYLVSEMTDGHVGVPWPMNPCAACPAYPQGNGIYWIDNRYTSGSSLSSAPTMTSDSTTNYDITPPSDGGDTNGGSTNYGPDVFVPDYPYLTNGSLWIEEPSNATQKFGLPN